MIGGFVYSRVEWLAAGMRGLPELATAMPVFARFGHSNAGVWIFR